eukprot:5568859-Amphidinium_carterae.1
MFWLSRATSWHRRTSKTDNVVTLNHLAQFAHTFEKKGSSRSCPCSTPLRRGAKECLAQALAAAVDAYEVAACCAKSAIVKQTGI